MIIIVEVEPDVENDHELGEVGGENGSIVGDDGSGNGTYTSPNVLYKY